MDLPATKITSLIPVPINQLRICIHGGRATLCELERGTNGTQFTVCYIRNHFVRLSMYLIVPINNSHTNKFLRETVLTVYCNRFHAHFQTSIYLF